MTSIAVVASAPDAKFAEEVRVGLQAAGLDASVSQSLPKAASPHVVLIWSAALEAERAIDAQALIGLWSEDRLLVARRDATPLPLGLRDLPSLGPEANSREVADAARAATADRPVAPELKQLSRRYELVRVIGKGSMGIVYEGMDPRLHRKVAIKTILKGHMDDDDAAKEYSMRFMREAQAVARLNHPHIVQVYDFGEEKDVAYIVMEFIKGKELKNFFDANERFELKEAVRIMCELLDALDFAHEGGIVHRDVKPANVMLDGQARVKLADFGVARVSDDRATKDKAQAGIMFGGMVFMSPEQITGGIVDRRSDIFLAGTILYELLTGEKPFTGSGAWTIAKKIIQDHPPVPSSINNTISPLLDNVVNKALSKTVEGRYQTAKEFAAALRRALEGKFDEDKSEKTVVGSMGNLSSLTKPAVSLASVKSEGAEGASAAGSQDLEFDFWRAIKDGNDPDDFELYIQQFPTGIYAALAKRKIAKLRGTALEDANATELEKREVEEAGRREAEAEQKLADEKAGLEGLLAVKDVPKAKVLMGTVTGAILAIAVAGGGAWYYFSKSSLEKQAALTAALETATKASQELQQAQAKQQESLKALEEARAKEIAALKSGDATKIKEAQEAAKRAETDAAKQANAVKQREADAADARKKAQDAAGAAKSAKTDLKPDVPVQPKQEAVAAKQETAPEQEAKTETKATDPVAKAAEPPKAKSRSEREREEEDRLLRETAVAAAERGSARRMAAPERTEVAAVAPKAEAAKSAKGPDPEMPEAAAKAAEPTAAAQELPTTDLFQQAQAMESSDPRGAVKIYRSLARSGNGKAARRLGEIYDRGIPGVPRDYAEALQWYETARQLGESIAMLGRGSSGPAVAPRPVTRAPEVAAKSAPPKLEPAPAPTPTPTAIPELPKAAAPAPSVPAPEPAKAETAAPAPESRSGWFYVGGLLITLLVLVFIAWFRIRRARRRAWAKARQLRTRSIAAIVSVSSSAQPALLIANVSGSAKLYETAGDEVAMVAVDECLHIMRERTEASKGRVIKTMGDEVMSIFPTADAAADAAIEMQSVINELKPVGNSKIGVRIGLCCGPLVVQADGGVAGDAVDVAARLSHVAVKGQIVTARDTVMLMSPMLKSATRKITAIQIKGKAAEVEVYELMWQQSEDATTMAAGRSVYKPKKTELRLVLRGKELVLRDDITTASIGREEPADLVIEDPMASRSHAKVERRLDKFVLADHSANGTFVMTEGDQETVLRQEEFTLRGRGSITFGQSRTTATEFLEYEIVPEQSAGSPDATLFVSYSHKDRSRVEPIVSVIEEMGRRVWMDRSDITGQTGWAGQIVRAIRECRAVVLMASPNSYTSDQVVRELYLAMNHRKTIVPIEIEPAEMPDELQYILAPFQHHRLRGHETREVIGRALAAV